MNANDLKGKKVVLRMELVIDLERETDWIETIQNRVGDDEFDEESFKFFVSENYQDIIELSDMANSMKIEIV